LRQRPPFGSDIAGSERRSPPRFFIMLLMLLRVIPAGEIEPYFGCANFYRA
jgi:hypothetical protein